MIDKDGSFSLFFNLMAMCRIPMTFARILAEHIEMKQMDYLIKVLL
ncbi:hypothetical protein bcere0022_26120 [Bacillus cereus Rock3-44]|nr:hypothetical protein bcere0022_26120 [Bacillus cereus Rock3-44]